MKATDTIWSFLAVVIVVSGLVQKSGIVHSELVRTVLVWVLAVAALLLAGLTGYIFRARYNLLYHGFKVVSRTEAHEIDDHDHKKNKHIAEFIVDPHAKDLMIFPIRFTWNGPGREKPIVLDHENGLSSLAIIDSEGEVVSYAYNACDDKWGYYFIAVSPPKNRHDPSFKIGYSQEYTYDIGKADNMLKCNLKHRTKELTLKVKFPKGIKPTDIELVCEANAWYRPHQFYDYKHNAETYPTKDKPYYDAHFNHVKWPIENPKKGCAYYIKWSKIE